MAYDVFISCKSEDYDFAEEVYDFLKANDFTAFLATMELSRLGESQYRGVITNAIDESYHLIVFLSKAEYLKSKWVAYEWDIFVNAQLNGRKEGNIILILKDITTKNLPSEYLPYETLTYGDFRKRLLNYVVTPESKIRPRLNKLKRTLVEKANDYEKNARSSASNICDILDDLDVESRSCPVCSAEIGIREPYCPECGWPVRPWEGLSAVNDLDDLPRPRKKNLKLFSEIYKKSTSKAPSYTPAPAQPPQNTERIGELLREIREYKEAIDLKDATIRDQINEIAALKQELEEAREALKINARGSKRNLTICLKNGFGKHLYYTPEELMSISEMERHTLNPIGICIMGKKLSFLIDFNQSNGIDWYAASLKGVLPSVEQLLLVNKYRSRINEIINYFNETPISNEWYWSCEVPKGSHQNAWIVYMNTNDNCVKACLKVSRGHVLTVLPAPESVVK